MTDPSHPYRSHDNVAHVCPACWRPARRIGNGCVACAAGHVSCMRCGRTHCTCARIQPPVSPVATVA